MRFAKVINVSPQYTGGGIYIYWGELSDGTYFMAETPYWDLRIVDEDPRYTYNPEYSDFDADQPRWQEDHLIQDVDSTKTQDFFDDMFTWILKNKPDDDFCNYSLGDMEEALARNNNETGSSADRMHTEL